jgi:hypothetical protein
MVGRKLRRHGIALVALALAMLPLVASTAAGDQFFHTSHAALTPIGSAPLQSGFVNDMHTGGVTISAQERYQLNGAMPNTEYSVALHISVADSTCTVVNARVTTSTFTTNASGNGEAGHTFFAASPLPPPNPRVIYIRWVVSSGGIDQYQTDCVAVTVGA